MKFRINTAEFRSGGGDAPPRRQNPEGKKSLYLTLLRLLQMRSVQVRSVPMRLILCTSSA